MIINLKAEKVKTKTHSVQNFQRGEHEKSEEFLESETVGVRDKTRRSRDTFFDRSMFKTTHWRNNKTSQGTTRKRKTHTSKEQLLNIEPLMDEVGQLRKEV